MQNLQVTKITNPEKCQEGCKQKPKELTKQSAILHRLCILPIQLRTFQRITPTEAEVFQNGRQVPVCQGLQWISNSPCLQNAPLVQFDDHDCQQNIMKTEKIMSDIRTKFEPQLSEHFCSYCYGTLECLETKRAEQMDFCTC